jgi:hypothetical protein
VTDLFTSIEGSALAAWVRESPSIWAYATILTLHTVGLAIVVGVNVVVDLRLLGWAPAISLTALRAVFPVMWAGFAINFASGLLLFIADATTKSVQLVFYVKLTCITLALIVARTIAKRLRQPDDRNLHALATASLLLWAGAIVAGRLMAYL